MSTNATFKSSFDGVEQAMAHIRKFATTARLDREDALKLQLVVEELMSNTIKHGCVARNALIELTLDDSGKAITLHYSDNGIAFDPVSFDLTARRHDYEGGYGLKLVRGFCRDLTYERQQDCNRLSFRLPISERQEP